MAMDIVNMGSRRALAWTGVACLAALSPQGVANAATSRACKPSTAELSAIEQRNVKAACAEIAAEMSAWADPAGGRQKLDALLADNFTWVAPTTEAARFHRGDKADYLRHIATDQAARYASGSGYEIVDTTAQEDRVAIDMVSKIRLKDGGTTGNRHHLLYRFDNQGKLVEARQYSDSAAVANDERRSNTKAALAFLAALTSGSGADAGKLLGDDFRWYSPGNAPSSGMDRAQAVKTIDSLPKMFSDFSIGPIADGDNAGITAQGDRVAIEARTNGWFKERRYENRYHFLFVVRDGLIRELKEYNDTQHKAEVFGG